MSLLIIDFSLKGKSMMQAVFRDIIPIGRERVQFDLTARIHLLSRCKTKEKTRSHCIRDQRSEDSLICILVSLCLCSTFDFFMRTMNEDPDRNGIHV